MPPILALFTFFAFGVLLWKLATWLPPRLREPTLVITLTATYYAATFFLVCLFAVYMVVHLAGRHGLLPHAYFIPVLILAVIMLIGLPAYATYYFYKKCPPRAHKAPTVRRVAGRKPPGGRGPLRF